MSNAGSFFVVTGCLATGYVCYHLAREWWTGRSSSGPPSSLQVVCVGDGVSVSTPVVEDVEAVMAEVVCVGDGVSVSTPVVEEVEAVMAEMVCVGDGVPVSTPVVEDMEAVMAEEVREDVEEEERIAAWDRAEIAFMLDVMVEAVETSLEGTTGGHPSKTATTRRALSPICKSRKEWMAIWEEPKKKRFKGLRKLLNYFNCFRKKKQ